MVLKTSKSQVVLIISSGLSLGFVLFVYKAFGIDQVVSFSGHSFAVRVVLFMLNVSVIFSINEFLIRPKLQLTTSIKVGLWIAWEVFSAASATHLLFNYFWNWTESNWHSYLLLLAEMTSVLVIPFGIYFLLKNKESSPSMMVFTSENGKEKYAVHIDALLYVKAEDNYVKVVYKSNGDDKSFIIRRKLSDLEQLFPSLYRVHRSYLVSANNVVKVEQHSKGMAVHFSTGSQVPVSEKYSVTISQFLNHPS